MTLQDAIAELRLLQHEIRDGNYRDADYCEAIDVVLSELRAMRLHRHVGPDRICSKCGQDLTHEDHIRERESRNAIDDKKTLA